MVTTQWFVRVSSSGTYVGHPTLIACVFLARRDECPESYCRTPGVGVGVGVRVHKNFNLAYNSWTTIGRAFIFHMYSLWQDLSIGTKIFDLVTLT